MNMHDSLLNSEGIPIVSVIGYSGSGKTTLIEKLIPLLKNRNIRLGIIKHDAHRFEMDHEGKDTWRFTNAGADVVAISSPEKAAVVTRREMGLDELCGYMRGVDLIITEGYKASDRLKIEVHRRATGKPMYEAPENLLAIVTDAQIETDTPCFAPDDAEGVADFLERLYRPYYSAD